MPKLTLITPVEEASFWLASHNVCPPTMALVTPGECHKPCNKCWEEYFIKRFFGGEKR